MFIDNKIFINNCKITKLKIDIKLVYVMNQQNKLYKILSN